MDQKVSTAIHGLLGIKFYPLEEANAIADCLENQFTPHDLCDVNHEGKVEARVRALLEAVDKNPPVRIRPCNLQELINYLKLKRHAELKAFQMSASDTFQDDHWYMSHISLITAFDFHIF
jgi:hypothetical protein